MRKMRKNVSRPVKLSDTAVAATDYNVPQTGWLGLYFESVRPAIVLARR